MKIITNLEVFRLALLNLIGGVLVLVTILIFGYFFEHRGRIFGHIPADLTHLILLFPFMWGNVSFPLTYLMHCLTLERRIHFLIVCTLVGPVLMVAVYGNIFTVLNIVTISLLSAVGALPFLMFNDFVRNKSD